MQFLLFRVRYCFAVILFSASEWVSNGDVPCKVALEVGVGNSPFYCIIGRVVGFHTKVGSNYHKVEVEAQTKTVGQCYLLVESIEAEGTTGLSFIVVYSPYITGVDKDCRLDFPEQLGAILNAEVEAYIATLVYKAVVVVVTIVATRAQ